MIAGYGRYNSTILKAQCYQSEWCRVVGVVTFTAVYITFSVLAIAWSGENRPFVVKKFIQNCGSLIVTQRSLFVPIMHF